MSREWKPGDVALICVSRGHGPEVAVSSDQQWFVAGPRLGSQHGWYHDRVEVVRPLVVIDPEDREAVERLIGAMEQVSGDLRGDRTAEFVQAALREFANPTPPKPEVLKHYIGSSDGGLKTALCGKVWRPNAEANVTVLGDCPTCLGILRDGRWSA